MENNDKYPFSPWTSQANELKSLLQTNTKRNIHKALNALDQAWVIDDANEENKLKKTEMKKIEPDKYLNNSWINIWTLRWYDTWWVTNEWDAYFLNDRWETILTR